MKILPHFYLVLFTAPLLLHSAAAAAAFTDRVERLTGIVLTPGLIPESSVPQVPQRLADALFFRDPLPVRHFYRHIANGNPHALRGGHSVVGLVPHGMFYHEGRLLLRLPAVDPQADPATRMELALLLLNPPTKGLVQMELHLTRPAEPAEGVPLPRVIVDLGNLRSEPIEISSIEPAIQKVKIGFFIEDAERFAYDMHGRGEKIDSVRIRVFNELSEKIPDAAKRDFETHLRDREMKSPVPWVVFCAATIDGEARVDYFSPSTKKRLAADPNGDFDALLLLKDELGSKLSDADLRAALDKAHASGLRADAAIRQVMTPMLDDAIKSK